MALRIIAEAILNKDATALWEQLVSFENNYKQLQKGLLEIENESKFEIEFDDEMAEQSSESSVKKRACNNCLSCALRWFCQYRWCSIA